MSLFSSGSPISQVIEPIIWFPISIFAAGAAWVAILLVSKILGTNKGAAHALGAIAFGLISLIGIKFMNDRMENASKSISNIKTNNQVLKQQATSNLTSEELGRRKEAYWRAYNQKEDDCRFPTTSALILECQRREGNRRQGFEIRWKQQIQAGWVPPPTP